MNNKIFLRLTIAFVIVHYCTIHLACSKQNEKNKSNLPAEGSYPVLLITQAQFTYVKGEDGKMKPQPGPAIMIMKQKTPIGWKDTTIEDPQSNVFHKALIIKDGGKKKIVTIGGMQAALKLWSIQKNRWQYELLWNPDFGGKWNRLRDMEIGDVNGDGIADIVMATHDQGVVAVAFNKENRWQVKEIDRESDTFVHEIEIGDIDGDGKNEFFATPSRPNKSAGGPQSGKVVMYKWNGSAFIKTVIESFKKTHAKEILAVNLNDKGKATLFAVIEAETKVENGETVRVEPVKIKQYSWKGKKIVGKIIAMIDDLQCRFLTAGDVDGDGKKELVASAMKSGIWLLKKGSGSMWNVTPIDKDSSGYEHATLVADLEGDGLQEIYVASDDQGELRRYQWNGTGFSKTVISPIEENRITWNLTAGTFY